MHFANWPPFNPNQILIPSLLHVNLLIFKRVWSVMLDDDICVLRQAISQDAAGLIVDNPMAVFGWLWRLTPSQFTVLSSSKRSKRLGFSAMGTGRSISLWPLRHLHRRNMVGHLKLPDLDQWPEGVGIRLTSSRAGHAPAQTLRNQKFQILGYRPLIHS